MLDQKSWRFFKYAAVGYIWAYCMAGVGGCTLPGLPHSHVGRCSPPLPGRLLPPPRLHPKGHSALQTPTVCSAVCRDMR